MGGRCGRAGRQVAIVGAALGLLLACSGGGGADDEADDDAGPDSPEAEAGALPEATCDLLADLEEADEGLFTRATFELDAAELDERLATRRRLMGDLTDATTGELHELLEWNRQGQAAVDEVLLADWDRDRAALAAGHDDRWLTNRLGDTVRRSDGDEVPVASVLGVRTQAHERLVLGCRAPELLDGPVQETDVAPPPGRLVFYRPGDPDEATDAVTAEVTAEGAGRLVTVDPAGTGERESPAAGAAPWGLTGALDAEPGDDNDILVMARQGDDRGVIIVTPDGELVGSVQRDSTGMGCPMWNDAGRLVVAEGDTAYADERRLFLLAPYGDRESGPLDLPFAVESCADFVSDDRLVVGDAALDIDDDRAVWTVDVDGGRPEQLYAPEGCTTQVGSVDPTGERVAVAQTCIDPLASGLVIVDLASGEVHRLVTGYAAQPKWSPDGEWLVFGFAPLGQPVRIGTWIVRDTGRQLREVAEAPAYSPVWLPPA